jgi:hypothetical protein
VSGRKVAKMNLENNDPSFYNGPCIPLESNSIQLHPLKSIINKKPAHPGNGGRFSFFGVPKFFLNLPISYLLIAISLSW